MAFDKTQPTDTTKIRNLGVVIRPNWAAILEADSTFQPYAVNLTDRDAAALSSDPTAISTAYIPYCKQDGSGNPELFGIDASSNVIQYSEAGRLGGPSQDFKMNNYRFGSGTVDYSVNNIVNAWIYWTNAGTVLTTQSSFQCSITRNAKGDYTIAFTSARDNSNYIVLFTPTRDKRSVSVTAPTTADVDLVITDLSGNDADTGGYVAVIGGI